ncbi:dnaJ homolog subfamily C member 22-like [Mytilus galloprovincialis]|uniref:dnaJ homolog subfamily C member 22-like n=1 Tax=Mytilus galloprovincialis TaxID=29158 RepID=UPI003F7B374D
MANLVVAYILWFFGGAWGLHHFYLGRDRHAFIWWSTWAGCFGLGWVRDLWRIPEYVYAANKDPGYLKDLNEKAKRYPIPQFNIVRFAGEVVVGFLFGILIRICIPDDYVELFIGRVLSIIVPPFAVAIGVHLVGNVNPEKVSFQWALLGAYISFPMLTIDSGNNLVYSSILSAIAVNWKGKNWNRDYIEKRGLCKRVFVLTVCGLLYLSLWSSAIYFNATITTKEGDEVPLREAINNFFTSPAWADTKESFRNLYKYYQEHGWENLYNKIVDSLDPLGESKAYKDLGVHENASEEEIKKSYKKLVKQWHPDKHMKETDPDKKAEAQKRFIEIQEAYETLSSIKLNRARRNKKSRSSSQDHREHTEF